MLVFNNSNNFVVLAHSTTPSLQRKKWRSIFDIFIFTTIIFSDSPGRLSAMMRKKKEPKRWRLSIRQRMAVMVMLLCFPPKGFSLNLKEKRWKVWFKSTRLTWRCGATLPRSILNLQKIEPCCWSASGSSLSAQPLQGWAITIFLANPRGENFEKSLERV